MITENTVRVSNSTYYTVLQFLQTALECNDVHIYEMKVKYCLERLKNDTFYNFSDASDDHQYNARKDLDGINALLEDLKKEVEAGFDPRTAALHKQKLEDGERI
jgi:hypothetical protein